MLGRSLSCVTLVGARSADALFCKDCKVSTSFVGCVVNDWAGIEEARKTLRKTQMVRKQDSPIVVLGG